MALPPPPPTAAPTDSQLISRCYRHPDREAGRSCTRCGKPACSECLVQAAVGSHCLDCAKAARPDVATRARFWNAGESVLVTKVIIAINLAVYLWGAIVTPGSLMGGGYIGPGSVAYRIGLNEYFLQAPFHEWYRLVTSGFLHFGLLHLGFNMFILWQLGNLIERGVGRLNFALMYFASLLAGSFGVILLGGAGITGGASGAVFGLMAAAAIGMHRRGVNIFSTGLGSTLMINLFITFVIPGISIGGHLGGIAGGAVCGWFMLAPPWKRQPSWVAWATPVGVMAASVLGVVILVR
jgi:membrane associated rhomboid family serine protease